MVYLKYILSRPWENFIFCAVSSSNNNYNSTNDNGNINNRNDNENINVKTTFSVCWASFTIKVF